LLRPKGGNCSESDAISFNISRQELAIVRAATNPKKLNLGAFLTGFFLLGEDGALSGLSKLKMLNIGAAMNDVMYSEAGKDPITKLAEFVAAQSPVPISKLHFLDHPAIVEAVDSPDPIPLIRSASARPVPRPNRSTKICVLLQVL
jgi:hypothetical protein